MNRGGFIPVLKASVGCWGRMSIVPVQFSKDSRAVVLKLLGLMTHLYF